MDLQVIDDNLPARNATEVMLSTAVEKGLDVESIKALIDLKNREEDRMCKRLFDEQFVKLKRALPIITKTKEAKNKTGGTMYKYATLDSIQRACDKIIAEHGFTYYWSEQDLEKGKRVIMTISGYGHNRETFFDVPLGESNAMKNAIQVAGEMSTYGKRYTFVSGFGLTLEGEDNDAQLSYEQVAEYAEEALAIQACTDLESLLDKWKVAHARYSGDPQAIKSLSAIFTKKKKELKDDSTN